MPETYTRYQTLPDGRRKRLTVSKSGRILDINPVKKKVGRTRTGKRLANRRRRIYR